MPKLQKIFQKKLKKMEASQVFLPKASKVFGDFPTKVSSTYNSMAYIFHVMYTRIGWKWKKPGKHNKWNWIMPSRRTSCLSLHYSAIENISYLNLSCPAVSHICSLTDLPPILTILEPNSTPIVWCESCLTKIKYLIIANM